MKAPCLPDPDDPHGPCIPCIKAGRAKLCGLRTYPPPKAKHLGDDETVRRFGSYMHYLDPETRERVKAAAALAQQKERSMTTPDTHIENSRSDGLGVAPLVKLVYLGLILIF